MKTKAKNLKVGNEFKFAGSWCQIIRVYKNDMGGVVIDFYASESPYSVLMLIMPKNATLRIK